MTYVRDCVTNSFGELAEVVLTRRHEDLETLLDEQLPYLLLNLVQLAKVVDQIAKVLCVHAEHVLHGIQDGPTVAWSRRVLAVERNLDQRQLLQKVNVVHHQVNLILLNKMLAVKVHIDLLLHAQQFIFGL